MAEIRRSGRRREPVDYTKLNSGEALPKEYTGCTSTRKEAWSTSKLYHLEIVETKDIDAVTWVKVHYTDKQWNSSRYDEWRLARDVIDIPDCLYFIDSRIEDIFFGKT